MQGFSEENIFNTHTDASALTQQENDALTTPGESVTKAGWERVAEGMHRVVAFCKVGPHEQVQCDFYMQLSLQNTQVLWVFPLLHSRAGRLDA